MLKNQPIKPGKRNDLDRRWLSDDYFDLIVWYEADGNIHGFQLCYDKPGRERALTWRCGVGFWHTGIDTGETNCYSNLTPILVADGVFPAAQVRDEFMARGRLLPPEIRDLVLGKIAEYEKRPGAERAG